MKSIYFVCIVSIVCLANCGKRDKVDTHFIQEAIKERKIKKISEAEITEAGLNRGREDTQILLACANRGDAVSVGCLDSVRTYLIDTINIITSDSDSLKLSEMEEELYKAYEYNFGQGQNLFPNLQDMNNGTLCYSSPFFKYEGEEKLYEERLEGKKPSSLESFLFIM